MNNTGNNNLDVHNCFCGGKLNYENGFANCPICGEGYGLVSFNNKLVKISSSVLRHANIHLDHTEIKKILYNEEDDALYNEFISNILCKELDTRDKRYMFLKILFPGVLPNINIEGSPKNAAYEMVNYFRKNGERYLKEFQESIIKYFS